MDELQNLLIDRAKTHGDFNVHARISQSIKKILLEENDKRLERDQIPLTDRQIESLTMIAHKIGRIIAGDSTYCDHWDDIAGYAKLCGSK